MQENRNTLVAITLSILVLILWTVFYEKPKIEAYQRQQIAEQEQEVKLKKSQIKSSKGVISNKKVHLSVIKIKNFLVEMKLLVKI